MCFRIGGDPVQTHPWVPPCVSDSLGLRRVPQACISDKLPSNTDGGGASETHFENHRTREILKYFKESGQRKENNANLKVLGLSLLGRGGAITQKWKIIYFLHQICIYSLGFYKAYGWMMDERASHRKWKRVRHWGRLLLVALTHSFFCLLCTPSSSGDN